MRDLFLGFTQQTPSEHPRRVFLRPEDRRKTHALIVGSPGSGKSKLLEHMARRDIENRQGVCLLDIHGGFYHNLKRWCAYKNFVTSRDVILLDPSTGEHVRGFNPFRPKPGVEVDVQVAGMVEALLRVWGAEDTLETPTLDRVLRLVFTAMVVKEIPLHDAFYLVNFEEKEFRKDVVSSLTEPIIRAAWNELQTLKRMAEWRGEVLSTQNRLFHLASSKVIRRFMGILDDSFNLNIPDLMNEGKVLLVNLKESTQLTDDSAKAFAALLINDLFKSAIVFRDRDTLGRDPTPFYLYLDEWQNFVTPDIKKILAQARKFGLLLVLANQDLAQIRTAFSEDFLNTLMTCCQVKACFGGLNRADARCIAEQMLVGQIDLNETKYEIESTKFWPTYSRDKVYSRSSGWSQGTGSVSGMSWNPASEEWVPSSADSSSTFESGSEGEADIPILLPIPFKEVTSRTTYTLEEQLWRWSDRLMEQYQRHCFVKLPREKTIPMLVPLVRDYLVSPLTVAQYERRIAEQTNAKLPAEVDELLATQESLFGSRTELALRVREPRDEDFLE